MEALILCLETRQPFVVDKVNATREHRAPYVHAAAAAGYRVAAYWFDVHPGDAITRNAGREGRARVPVQAILGTYKRLSIPTREEGFDDVWRVQVTADGFEVGPLEAQAAGPRGA
jgi:predicted kinase